MPDLSDKIKEYLIPLNQSMLFDELSPSYQQRAGVADILRGVPVPIAADAAEQLTTLSIAMGMARVIGADPEFRYAPAYIDYLRHMFGDGAAKVLVSEGAKNGGLGHFELACVYFRAALQLNPGSRDALYLYGRACKDAYEQEDKDEKYVGCFKAQSIEVFEVLTIEHPKYAMGFYFLGYSYANMGLYTKAQLTWEEFMNLTRSDSEDEEESDMEKIPDDEMQELREEIGGRLEAMETPVQIEKACNRIMSGDYQGGRDMLSEFTEGPYSKWWPLWYYLGIADSGLGNAEEAIEDYREALRYSPSNTQVMTELIDVYQAVGDWENAEKYIHKIQVIQQGLEEETAE